MSLSPQKSVRNGVACFISPHGFGHAARAAAVMAAIQKIDASVRFEIFTRVPRWFFRNSVSGPFAYHSLLTDIGLVQENPMCEDFDRTVQSLNAFLPFDDSQIADLARGISRLNCKLIICDIAPMGIAVARLAGIPSLLIENFTWDWIYKGYTAYNVQADKHIKYLHSLFNASDYHIQAEPVCCRHEANLTTLPVSRKIRTPRPRIRKKLGIPDNHKMVMVTMGGVSASSPPDFRSSVGKWKKLTDKRTIHFVIPGGAQSVEIHDNLVFLPYNSDFFHPDLINACDALIGKVGYSTLAEVFYAGIPFGYISRPSFPESEILVEFIKKEMTGFRIEGAEFQDGRWLSRVEDLFSLPRVQRDCPDGAEQAAHFIYELL
ncbi:hypothetical protein [Desulfonema magnum]|uniref:Glycosyl transferase family 28 C-terminal domain-containing protein n=1 Tax=Desulfonema magnum TaxID=45655 RepID=A0A975BKC9_9BACT|nr:hypothetical protein [Desulfonema magnum]QTA86718.1 Uncharacterized protein dnm_027420 [Desulfonema magnum]